MHWLSEKPSRLVAKIVCCLGLIALSGMALTAPARADGHGFNKGNWPFRPLEQPQPPATAASEWAINPIDPFVLAELEKKGLAPNQPAEKATLLRRVTFDLIGLAPTPAEIDAFLEVVAGLAA